MDKYIDFDALSHGNVFITGEEKVYRYAFRLHYIENGTSVSTSGAI